VPSGKGEALQVSIRKREAVAAVVVGLVLACSIAWGANAAGGYGPLLQPSLPGAPVAFASQVKTALMFNGAGGYLSTTGGGSIRITVIVPKHTFSKRVQIVITAPAVSEMTAILRTFHFTGYSAVTGFGVAVNNTDGTAFKGKFSKPIQITLAGKPLELNQKVVSWSYPTSQITLADKSTRGKVTVSTRSQVDLIVVRPTAKDT
jgi:hypothetical protein